MTISSNTTQVTGTGNGTTTTFNFPNKIFTAEDLTVTLIDTSGNQYPFVDFANALLGMDYSVNNVDVDTGCSITFNIAPTLNWTIDMRSTIAELQTTSIKNQGDFLPELHEDFFDKATRMLQDLYRRTYTYGIHGPDIETTAWTQLPSAASRAGTYLGFDTNGLPICTSLPVNALNYGLPLPGNTGMNNGAPYLSGAALGSASSPTTNAQPLIHFAVYTDATSGLGNGYVGGALWASNYVYGGSGFGKALTGYLEIDSPVTPFVAGDASIAVHAFGHITSGIYGANVTCGWDTAHDDNAGIVVTGATGNGTTATLSFAALAAAPAVGLTINVSGINPSVYNGNWTVTASSTTSVSFASSAASAYVSGGQILTNQIFGREIDLVMNAGRVRSTGVLGNASGVCLWLNNQSNVNGDYHAVAAIGITGQSGSGNTSQFWSGIFFQQNCCVPGTSECVQMNGGSVSANAYGGLRLLGWFNDGIDLSGATFTGTAAPILLPNGNGIVSVNGAGNGSYTVMYANSSNVLVLGQGMTSAQFQVALGVNGNGAPAQVTGWGTPTGNGVISNFPGASATLAQTSEVVAQLLHDMKAIGFYGT